ncbi:MAG: EAL domain-containing protein [Candidatus Omnitrophica bacterium]|nr:EAL domain-containing protein [Candidatus Omnitrophota bacterium]
MLKGNASKKRILLVDDDRAVSQMLTMLLETRGYEVLNAFSGAEALEKADESTDLILLDLILPDEEGFDVCRKLKEQPKTADVPIIILSARVLSGDIVEGLYLGADDYLTKPFEYEELVARMEAVMRRGSLFHNGSSKSNGDEEVVRELRRIIEEERITPFYQPIFLLKPFKLFGLEALCRPNTESMLANPELLFKAAIKYGCYQDLELLSWKKAIAYASEYLHNEFLFLNCNPYLIEGPKFLSIKSLFENCGFSIGNVVLEITERSEVGDFKEFYTQLGRFREQGFKFAVDDVGGGYASLESIVETKPEVVKIDRHIINNLDSDPYKRSIVKFVVAFCRENNIFSIAEGIETKEDLQKVIEIGVDAAQGYYLSKPSPEINIKALNATVSQFA